MILAASLALCGMALMAPTMPKDRKVLLIGIDGVRPDALVAAETPKIDALMKSGAWSLKAMSGDVTISGPCWSSILTGVGRAKHRVNDNTFAGSRYDLYPTFLTRLKRHDLARVTASAVNWAPLNEHPMRDADHRIQKPTDKEVVAALRELFASADPDAIFVDLDEVDAAGHAFGYSPSVPEYVSAIGEADRLVGELLELVLERKAAEHEDWLILITTDHGGEGKGHGSNSPACRTVFFIAGGPSVEPGEIVPPPKIEDVAPTALAHLGVPIRKDWGLDGRVVGLKAASNP